MKNPLIKRLPRELKSDLGKYLVIFLFMTMLVSLISGFLVADNSFIVSYNEGFEKYNIEDGNIAFDRLPDSTILSKLEQAGDLTFYELFYREEQVKENDSTLRIYKNRTQVDLACLWDGALPSADNEIALDRMYANNNKIEVGDQITVGERKLTVSGLIAVPDYSCLFQNNSDMMFDAIGFGVAVMSEPGFDLLGEKRITYNYAWKYNTPYADDEEADRRSRDFLDTLEEVIKDYDQDLMQQQVDNLYARAKDLSKELEEEFTTAGEVMESKISEASEEVAKEAVSGLSSAEKKNMTVTGLVAEKLGTTETALDDLSKAMDSLEDSMDQMQASTEPVTIDLDDYEDGEDVDTEIDFSLDEIRDVTDKLTATGLYDTAKIYHLLGELESLMDTSIDEGELLSVKNYIPRYLNSAINFTGEDMGGDKIMFLIFDYIIVLVLAFIFAVTTANTIQQEAGVIGTLRASGYSRGELIRHYMVLPVLVTLVAAIVGNILGYTYFCNKFSWLYLNSYSLGKTEILFNAEAFIDTTVVPLILMTIINLVVLVTKLQLSPLKFLRRDLKKHGSKRAVRLSGKIPFMQRFGIRILLQNLPAYLVLAFGVFFGGLLIIFGSMFTPLLEDYAQLVKESQIAKYQYVLMDQVETENGQAEKYCVTNLDSTIEGYKTDSIMIYGIEDNSRYVRTEDNSGTVGTEDNSGTVGEKGRCDGFVSNGMAAKYGLSEGDIVTLKDPYSSKTYDFVVTGVYQYDAALSIFVGRDAFNDLFEKEEDYFTGYFSNEKLEDIDSEDIATIIDEAELTKMSDQLKHSMGDFMSLFQIFGVIMFLMLMYLLIKQILEKNLQSIAMSKILGFTNAEIGRLYLVITSVVVLVSLLITVPLIDLALRWIFSDVLYTEMTGYIPYIISPTCYVKMIVLGIVSFLVVSGFMMIKIERIPKSEALKNVE